VSVSHACGGSWLGSISAGSGCTRLPCPDT
jgi:hypothetical protein